MKTTSRPTLTPGLHYQHVSDPLGTKLLACLLCSPAAVPFFVHRDDFPGYTAEDSLFKVMYTHLLAHLYSAHARELRPLQPPNQSPPDDPGSSEIVVESLLAIADDEEEALDTLHDAIFALAKKHGSPKPLT